MDDTPAAARPSFPAGTPLLLATLMLGVFIAALDLAILAPALLTLGAEFGVAEADLSWVFTAYILAAAAGLPLMAKLSDKFGRRPIYILDLCLFAGGSIVCAMAPSYAIFLAGRVIQAFGAGGIFPIATAVIGDVIPTARRGLTLGLVSSIWGVATLVGPPVGGVIVQQFGWQWIFLINLPLCVAVILLAMKTVPSVARGWKLPFDFAGLVLLIAALLLLMFGISQIDGALPFAGLLGLNTGAPIAVSLILFGLWARTEARAPDPIVHLELIRHRQLGLVNLISTLAGFMEAALIFAPTYAILLLGLDTQTAGLVVVVGAIAFGVATPISGALIDKIGSRIVIIGGGLLTGVGLAMVATIVNDIPSFLIALIIGGIGMGGLLGTPTRYIVTRETARGQRAIALALVSLFDLIGIGIGTAVTSAVVGSFHENVVEGYATAYLLLASVAFIIALVALGLKSRSAERATKTTDEVSTPSHPLDDDAAGRSEPDTTDPR